MIRVFVIVLNWNRKKDTLDCISSLKKSNTKGLYLEVVVADNGSSDGSVEALKKLKINVIENEKNLGFAQGNNMGMLYALGKKADYLVVLNNDTVVDKNLITNCIDVMEGDKKIGALSPKIYFARGFEFHKKYKETDLGKVIWYAGGDIDWNNVYGSNHGVDKVDSGQFEKEEKTDFATGACIFLRSAAIFDVGVFDSKYFMYLEDADLCQRLMKKGWKVIFSPKGHLWHKVAQSSGIGSDLNDYFITRNRLLFGMRYAPLRAKFALFRESIRFLWSGRKWQRIGVLDFYLGRMEKGSWI